MSHTKDQLMAHLQPLLHAVKDMTAGHEAEHWLNTTHGVDSDWYIEAARLVRRGLEEGWVADAEIGGPRYRRAQLMTPSAETFFFSITGVLLDSTQNTQGNPEGSLRAAYHMHPYGEFNLVVPLNDGAALAGPNGWCHGGWTTPAPASHHYPEVKGGAAVSLTFLPAGRIAFDVPPPKE